MEKVGRNDPCPCGSGKKYKNCHQKAEEHSSSSKKTLIYLGVFLIIIVLGVMGTLMKGSSSGPPAGPAPEGKVWSEEHQHYH